MSRRAGAGKPVGFARTGGLAALALVMGSCSFTDREEGEILGALSLLVASVAFALAAVGSAGVALRVKRMAGSRVGPTAGAALVAVFLTVALSLGWMLAAVPSMVLAFLGLDHTSDAGPGPAAASAVVGTVTGGIGLALGALLVANLSDSVPLVVAGLVGALVGLAITSGLVAWARAQGPGSMDRALLVGAVTLVVIGGILTLATLVGTVTGFTGAGAQVDDLSEYRARYLPGALAAMGLSLAAGILLFLSLRAWWRAE